MRKEEKFSIKVNAAEQWGKIKDVLEYENVIRF